LVIPCFFIAAEFDLVVVPDFAMLLVFEVLVDLAVLPEIPAAFSTEFAAVFELFDETVNGSFLALKAFSEALEGFSAELEILSVVPAVSEEIAAGYCVAVVGWLLFSKGLEAVEVTVESCGVVWVMGPINQSDNAPATIAAASQYQAKPRRRSFSLICAATRSHTSGDGSRRSSFALR
jgi:hypothetical protein